MKKTRGQARECDTSDGTERRNGKRNDRSPVIRLVASVGFYPLSRRSSYFYCDGFVEIRDPRTFHGTVLEVVKS